MFRYWDKISEVRPFLLFAAVGFRENISVQIRFLLGPAGSGKTFRCLSEIRDALRASADGKPLVLLAPKQATFQLERQLLDSLPGYTRLHILSFERLADFVFDGLGQPAPELLSEEGRVMVLRALLEKKRTELELFRASARLPGFARQLSELLRELQRYHLSPARLETLAGELDRRDDLRAKLRDLALIIRAYGDWLKEHHLQDADTQLDLATEALRPASPGFQIEHLWLDGFAQMTPQERRLLSAVIQRADKATLAFCIDGEPAASLPWHSSWAPVSETFLRLRDQLRQLPEATITTEVLTRKATQTRFEAPELQHVEKHWGRAVAFAQELRRSTPSLRLACCTSPEAEVELAAREIRRFVREQGARYREIAVLLRSLDGYHHIIRRVFARYDIPLFLDRRESVAHHPLAELTRYALRVVARNWEHDDWFGALKTGLVHADDSAIDRLENEALGRGWRGKSAWLDQISDVEWVEALREPLIAPFRAFAETLAATKNTPTGTQLADAFRELWRALDVPKTLERWNAAQSAIRNAPSAIHETVWEQMTEWLRNIELAFGSDALSLGDWLPILEAGLGNLTVGVVPPALDQVLVGAIDRSRNPDLQLAFVLGVNEGVFPAPPQPPRLLNRAERETLAEYDAPLGPDFLTQIGLERYYGYIACTRARKQLILTYAQRDGEGRELNASQFITDLQKQFPAVKVEAFACGQEAQCAEHWNELAVPLLRSKIQEAQGQAIGQSSPAFASLLEKARCVSSNQSSGTLPPQLAEKIYGMELRSSVSGLEEFAKCPFQFFVSRGLRAEERDEFEIDPREKGSFQHEILSQFHLRLGRRRKRWRDISPAEARKLVRDIGEELLPKFRDGLFAAAESRRFTAELLIEGLEKLVETLIGWTKQYQFDPLAVEASFGLEERGLPAWRIDLDGDHALILRGRIDRIDVCRIADTGETLGVVIDYKSSARQLDKTLLHHGLELQLLAYLGVLSQLEDFAGIRHIIPAGAFFVPLKSNGSSASTRDEERDAREESRHEAFQHRGRFDGGHLEKFDLRRPNKGEQFQFSVNKDGSFSARGNEALATDEFRGLVRKVEDFLRQHGRDIYSGKVEISPYRVKNETACDFCMYGAVCRFDPWVQPYRVLRPPPKAA